MVDHRHSLRLPCPKVLGQAHRTPHSAAGLWMSEGPNKRDSILSRIQAPVVLQGRGLSALLQNSPGTPCLVASPWPGQSWDGCLGWVQESSVPTSVADGSLRGDAMRASLRNYLHTVSGPWHQTLQVKLADSTGDGHIPDDGQGLSHRELYPVVSATA